MTEKDWLECDSPGRMLEYLKRCRRYTVAGRQVLLFGCRTARDILFADEWRARMASRPRFRFVVTLSRGEEDWPGLRGYVQAHVGALLATLPAPHLYICGLSRMITEVRRVLKEDLGVDRRRVHSERYD